MYASSSGRSDPDVLCMENICTMLDSCRTLLCRLCFSLVRIGCCWCVPLTVQQAKQGWWWDQPERKHKRASWNWTFFLEQTSESGLHPVDCVMSMAAAWRYQPAAAGKWSNPNKPKSSVRQSLTSNFRSDWLPLCMNLASVIDFLPVVIRMLYSVAVENFFH